MSIQECRGLLLALLAACADAEPTRESALPSPSAARPTEAISAAGLDSEAGVLAFRVARFAEARTRGARDFLASGGDGDPLWAAAWLYAFSIDTTPLVPLLTHRDPSVRVMAAAALAALEHPGGMEVLRAERRNQTPLRGAEPPLTIAKFSEHVLDAHTDHSKARNRP